jgi:hypothetical protein
VGHTAKEHMLEHSKTDCVGEWRLVMDGERRLICVSCAAEYVATPALRKAAIDENLAGTFLRRLADEGDTVRDLDDVA